jgi:cell division protein FtsB
MRFRIWPICLVLLCLLQAHLWFDSGGIVDMLKMKKQLAIQIDENNRLKSRNVALIRDVQFTKNDKSAIESHARDDLGMVKKDEIFYQIVN